MRGFGRLFLLGVLWAAGCADHTFDLLPGDGAAPLASSGGGGDTGGLSGAGRGTAGKPSAGRGGAGGMSGGGRGGTGPLPAGRGGGGSGGTGLVSEGGAGDETACTFAGCCAPGVPGCFPCPHGDSDCPYNEVCSLTHGCVPCRPPTECPNRLGCDLDCATDERCDFQTYTCQKDCARGQECPASRPTCDKQREVCVVCDASQSPSGCTYPYTCSPIETCVECLLSSDCKTDPTRPYCSDSWTCRGCRSDNECNSQNTPATFYRTCDRSSGACVSAQQP